jgi:hypothetical protein
MVVTGVIGRTMLMAAVTTKVKLLLNGHPGDFFCWNRHEFFNAPSTSDVD